MPALDSITLKHHLVNDFSTRIWKDMTESYWRSASGQRTPEDIAHYGSAATNDLVASYPSPNEYRQYLARAVQFSDNYYISPEMCVLVTAAAESMPEDEQPKPEDFPTPGGWLLIPNGIVQSDIRGAAVVTNVILWRTSGGVVRLTYLADKFHPLDRANTYDGILRAAKEEKVPDPQARARRIWDQIPRLTVWHDMDAEFHHRLPTSLSLGAVIPPEVSSQITVRDLPDGGRQIYWPVGYDVEGLRGLINPNIHPEPVFRWLLACLRLMQQELTSVTQQGLPANLRRSLKGKVRLKNTHVSVIEYRRRSGSMPSESSREYTHRFLRRGHWRKQPYKNDDGEWDRKSIWIHPTIVGDPSLPLRLREHVKALVR